MSLLGILSDAHGHLEGFDVAIRSLRSLGVHQFAFLGDAVGYVPSAGVVRRLAAMDGLVACVLGNHEAMLLEGDFSPDRDQVYQLAKVRPLLSSAEVDFIRAWPSVVDMERGRFRLRLVHGSPDDPTYGYVYPDTDLAPFRRPADFVFMGNSHHPFVRTCADCTFVNVGSCGLPRDHGSLGSAAVFDDAAGTAQVYRFDIAAANDRLRSEFTDLHPSVISVMSRVKDDSHGTRI